MGSGAVAEPQSQPRRSSDTMPAQPGTDLGIEVEATELLYAPEPPKEPSRAPWLIVAALALLAGHWRLVAWQPGRQGTRRASAGRGCGR